MKQPRVTETGSNVIRPSQRPVIILPTLQILRQHAAMNVRPLKGKQRTDRLPCLRATKRATAVMNATKQIIVFSYILCTFILFTL
jgi:hypothetical protein